MKNQDYKKLDLTIIIPLFNSEKFVIDTLKSLYSTIQNCKGGAIVIDDGSIDNSINIVKKYILKNKIQIKIYKLNKNYGAGYAKNFGIIQAKSKYIFVCDSDNIYNFESIQNLYLFLENNKNFQAAHFQKSFHFYKNVNRISFAYDWSKFLKKNNYIDIKTMLSNQFDLDNFMMTKESYLKSEGYGMNHGFDTQGLGVNYLIVNRRVAVVNRTYYKHRRHLNIKSYYTRETTLNRFGINFYLIFENLVKYKKDILINFFKLKLFSENNNLYKFLNMHKKKRKDYKIIKTFNSWYINFKKKNFLECIILSSKLLKDTNFSDLAIYLVFRSYYYKFNSFNITNDIASYELLRNFYEKRDYSSFRQKIISKSINKFRNFIFFKK